jgi:hypothetical protein
LIVVYFKKYIIKYDKLNVVERQKNENVRTCLDISYVVRTISLGSNSIFLG